MDTPTKITRILEKYKLTLSSEGELQREIEDIFKRNKVQFSREVILDQKNRVDFVVDGWAIEVKIKGSAPSIYRQCVRYCGFDAIRGLMLLTNKSHGMPKSINGKPVVVLHLGKAWL